MLKNSAIAAMLSLALILTGCANGLIRDGEQTAPSQSVSDILKQARVIVIGVETTAPELAVIGDISEKDADSLVELVGKVKPHLDLAIKIADGTESGDPIKQLDAAITLLRTARDSAGSDSAKEVIGRVTAALVFYRSMLNQPN